MEFKDFPFNKGNDLNIELYSIDNKNRIQSLYNICQRYSAICVANIADARSMLHSHHRISCKMLLEYAWYPLSIIVIFHIYILHFSYFCNSEYDVSNLNVI